MTPFELKRENDELRRQLAFMVRERDEAIARERAALLKAEECCHIMTYQMEQSNHKGLELICGGKREPQGDGPDPGMFGNPP